jgi:hypothetical protein
MGKPVGNILLGTQIRRLVYCNSVNNNNNYLISLKRLCGLVVRYPSYKSGDPGSIHYAIRFSEKQCVWNGVHSAS